MSDIDQDPTAPPLSEEERREQFQKTLATAGAARPAHQPAPVAAPPASPESSSQDAADGSEEDEVEDPFDELFRKMTFHVSTMGHTATLSHRAAEAFERQLAVLEKTAARLQEPPATAGAPSGNEWKQWLVSGSVCFGAAALVLAAGWVWMSREADNRLQLLRSKQVAAIQATTAQNRQALQNLAMVGVTLEIRKEEGKPNGFFLVLKGAHAAEPPLNVPDGIAIPFQGN